MVFDNLIKPLKTTKFNSKLRRLSETGPWLSNINQHELKEKSKMNLKTNF